jgi:hypothetical protein
MRTITLALTTWGRYELLIESFVRVLTDPRVSEIVIVSDCDEKLLFDKIKLFCAPYPKIKLYYNISNQDCYRNKQIAISYSENPWLIIGDSDNVFSIEYVDKLFAIDPWENNCVYQPDFAMPSFDFAEFSGHTITKENVSEHLKKYRMMSTCLNAMNYFVNRDEYLKVWDGNIEPHTADSIYQNYRWLDAGNKIKVVPGLSYFHRIHEGSHYQNNVHKTGRTYQIIENRLLAMK